MTPPKKVEPVPASSDPSLEEVLSKIKIYEKITSENPKHHRAWDTLGMLYKSIGRYKDAIQAYLHALDGAPQNENLYYYLGLLYAMEQQDENAILSFEEVLRINPDYILAHSALAGVFRRLGKEAQAREHIASAALQMNSESSYNRACFYAICGDVELSVEFLRLALQNDGTSLDWVKTDPDLEPIRNDPRYREMIHQFESASRHPEDGNFFSSDIDAPNNQLLPLLNDSLTR
jgi:tetratricopeptide (TPR) repeat protein